MVTAIQDSLNALDESFPFEVIYNPVGGSINIEEKSEGIHTNNEFFVPSDFGIMNWMSNIDSDYPWGNTDGTVKAVDINRIQFMVHQGIHR